MKINSNNLEINGNKIWHEGNDGSDSGLVADAVDGYHVYATPTANSLIPLDETGKFPEEVIPSVGVAGGDADTVDGFHANATPTANYLLPLDSNTLFPSSVLPTTIRSYESPIDLTNATEDYMLQVGEVARIDFTNATSVPLHIATQDGTYYEMHVVPSDPGGESGGAPYKTLVAPNNTNYTDKFVYAEVGRTEADTSTFYSTTADAFIIGQYFSDSVCYIINHTVYKCVKCMITAYGNPNNYPAVFLTSTNWRDTTTTWTSLGTVTFSQASSGRILVKRIM